MAYFNHAFNKCFVGTESFNTTLTGVLGTAGNILTTGQFGFVDPETWQLLDSAPAECCPLVLVAGALYNNDKQGPFHGGYQETNKSKMINPRYIREFYKVEACNPINQVVHAGSTPFTLGGGLILGNISVTTPGSGYADADGNYAVAVTGGSGTGAVLEVNITGGNLTIVSVINPGINYQNGDTGLGVTGLTGGGTDVVFDSGNVSLAAGDASCCHEFLCDETYYLRIDIKGSPTLRFLNHQAYMTIEAYTGCCDDDSVAPVAVDSTNVMIAWAEYILNDPIISQFLYPVVYDQLGTAWYAPGTDAAFLASVGADTWDNYVSPGYITDACAGIVLNAAYVDTRFGDCTFQTTDFYELEPLRIYASEVDLNGDPCKFEGLCVVEECAGMQAMGLGETVLRDVIMSESYRQSFFHSDLRIREITQGSQLLDVIDRTALYDRYYILHSVPRFNNPTGTFDNDQYLLDIIIPTGAPGAATAAAFEAFMNDWLTNCGDNCVGPAPELINCLSTCDPITAIPTLP